MKNFANNTFWRRAAMTLLLAVITTTVALADYFVLFNPNGGQSMGLPVRQVFSANTPQALMLNTYTRDSYDFVGWNTKKDGTGTAYADGDTITVTDGMVLYAQWQQGSGTGSGTDDTIKYYIEYDPNGATKNAIPIRKSIKGGQVTILFPCAFSREWCVFSGWNTAADGSGTAYTDQQKVIFTSDVKLYAQWDTLCGYYKLDKNTNTMVDRLEELNKQMEQFANEKAALLNPTESHEYYANLKEKQTNAINNSIKEMESAVKEKIVYSPSFSESYQKSIENRKNSQSRTQVLSKNNVAMGPDGAFIKEESHYSARDNDNEILRTVRIEAHKSGCEDLHGSCGYKSYISIADGAAVKFCGADNSKIRGEWPGITCEGDATIILSERNGFDLVSKIIGGKNSPGIFVPEGHTLTIKDETNGRAELIVIGSEGCAAIGGGPGQTCGSVVIESGKVTATGGKYAAAIGSGKNGSCGNITICEGASVTAVAGDNSEPVGEGENAEPVEEVENSEPVGEGENATSVLSIDEGLVDVQTEDTRVVVPPYSEFNIWVGDTRVSTATCADILGDGTASYDPETHTLTLDNPNITTTKEDAVIYSDGIDLTVKGFYRMNEALGNYGIFAKNGMLTMEGDFTFRGSSVGIYTDNNPLAVKGTLRAYGIVPIACLGEPMLEQGFFGETRVEENGVLTQSLAGYATGDGTAENPFEICNSIQWNKACEDVANGCATAGKHFLVANSLHATTMMGTADNPFAGTIDGQRQYFSVFAFIDEYVSGAALFPYVSGATIKNLLVEGLVDGGACSAGIVGKAVGGTTTIENCVFAGEVDVKDGELAPNWIVGNTAAGASVVYNNCLDATIHAWPATDKGAYIIAGTGGVSIKLTGTTGVEYNGAIWAPKDAVVTFTATGGNGAYAPSCGGELGYNAGIYSLTVPEEDVDIVPNDAVTYDITLPENITGGTVTCSKSSAAAGTAVYLTVVAADYYLIKNISVKTADDVELSIDEDGFFRMPPSDVTVSVEFVKKYTFENGVLVLMYGMFNNGEHGNFDTDITEHKSEVTKIAAAPGVRLNKSVSGLFDGFINCTEIDLQYVETSTMTITSNMFGQCAALKKLNMSGWDTSNVTDMSNMFYGCGDLGEIDLSGFVFADGVNVSNMFQGCGVYELTLPAGVGVTKEMQLNKGNHEVVNNEWIYSGWQKLGDPTQTSTFEQDANDPDFSYAVLPAQTKASTFVWKEMPGDFVLELPDGEDNRDLIALWDGMTVNVVLTGRTLYKDGEWNTLCLPFELGYAELGNALGYEYTVKMLNVEDKYNAAGDIYPVWNPDADEADYPYQTGFNAGTGELSLYFIDVYNNKLSPGAPYLIKWSKPDGYVAYNGTNAATCSDIVSPTFERVTITNTVHDAVSTDGSVKFRGTYDNRYFPVANSSIYFMGMNNTIYYPGPTAVVGPERAYFELSDPTAHVKGYAFNFGEDDVTAVAEKFNVQSSLSNDQWYTISGVKLNGKPNTKGVYINNGKKVVVK